MSCLRTRSRRSLGPARRSLRETADARVHGTTRQVVGERFLATEKAALLPLPAARFANFQEAPRRVHTDGHIEVAKAYYSAPPEYVGHTVWAR